MSVWDLLGFGTNWDRVHKMEEREYLENIASIIHSITCLRAYEDGIDGIADEFGAEKVYKVIKTFGKEIPTKSKYDKFKDYISISDLVPSARQVKKNEKYQEYWNIAYKWAMEYEKNRFETKITILEQEKKQLNKRVKELEDKLSKYEKLNNQETKVNSKSVVNIFYPNEFEK